MSYEKVKIIGVRQVTNAKGTHNFLEVEHMQTHSIYLNDDAVKLLPTFEKIKGKEALIPVTWGEYNGKPSMNLSDDFTPLPAPVRAVA